MIREFGFTAAIVVAMAAGGASFAQPMVQAPPAAQGDAPSRPGAPDLRRSGSRDDLHRRMDICWTRGRRPLSMEARAWCKFDAYAAAPDARLIDVMRAKADMIRALLAISPARCAEIMGSDSSDAPIESDALNRAGAAFFRAQIEAEYAGYTSPQRRGPVTQDDRRILIDALRRRHVNEAEAEAAWAAGTPNLPAPRRCFVQLAYFEAMAEAPSPIAGRLILRATQTPPPFDRPAKTSPR